MDTTQQIEEKVYKITKTNIFLLLVLAGFSLFLGFAFNFSVEDKIIAVLTTQIKNNKQCPANFKSIKINYFLPSVNISDLEINGSCLKTRDNLDIKALKLSPGFPSFSPLGLGLNTQLRDKNSSIDILSIHSFGSHHLKITSPKFDAKTIEPFLNGLSLKGIFDINSNIEATNAGVKTLNLLIKSKNFKVPYQNINGLDIPDLSIGNLMIKASMKNRKKLVIDEIVVGTETAPIRASVKGSIALDKYNLKQSRLDLTATVKLSPSFVESFPILNLFLDPSKQDAQGFYKVKIGGTLGRPSQPQLL
jgi:type II secretion system protein N